MSAHIISKLAGATVTAKGWVGDGEIATVTGHVCRIRVIRAGRVWLEIVPMVRGADAVEIFCNVDDVKVVG